VGATVEVGAGEGIELKRDERERLSLALYKRSAPDVA
jgi:hypothetical protein